MGMGTYDLAIVQHETLQRTFTWMIDGQAQSVSGYTIHSQVRRKEDPASQLLLDLAPYITPAVDSLSLVLRVPATVTGSLDLRAFRKAAWDLFLVSSSDPTDAVRLLQGAVSLDPASTAVGSP